MDEHGDVVDGDMIMYLCARYMQSKGQLGDSKVVTTIMSNIGLYKALDELGIGYEKTAVGDKYVYENMKANGHLIGGEQSGHIIFTKHAHTGDGLLTAIKVMQAVLEAKQPLSELVKDITIYPQVLKNAKVTDKDAALNDPDVQAEIAAVTARLGGDGRILVRKSGTEPVLRVMVEAGDPETCEKNVDAVLEVMKKKGLLLGIK